MGDSSIAPAVQVLLRDGLESFEQLEILLWLFRHRDIETRSDVLATELKIPPNQAKEAFGALLERDFVEARTTAGVVTYRFREGRPDRNTVVQALAEAYLNNRLEVMRLVSKNAVERVRTMAQRTFAEAFVLGRKKKDG